ncbi:hydrogenase nickel incorporation protein HypA/HybF [Sporobacter termitidis DSM 10068]|uniref:Hydrogenase maturation factor HypA n=1 Tax=Sporobacter termitidis DSM 10068 TaxID=1123282 RepID=A0A1M5Z0F1_9FIRM|nr:hydrogenase maturation nickel metallochaperone HypA [Sporobacter termitidis]SHI17746.1 hydrogenase nickel incorporation protein HypA/HybF [Sporobacter termitidis DSM 10068]
MHEYPLTKRIVDIAVREAEEQKARRVLAVRLVVGETSGIIAESVQMYFDVIAEGTPAEGAELLITSVKPEMRCPACGRKFIRPRFSFSCPDCGALGEPTETGREFYIESVELEI